MNANIHNACKAATTAIADIDFLAGREEFTRFMDRFRARADELADEILHDDSLDPIEREKRRNHRLGIMEVLGSFREIREASVQLLRQTGAIDRTEYTGD